MDTRQPAHRLHLLITASQHETLQQLSAESGAPVAELVRRALDKAYAPVEVRVIPFPPVVPVL